MIFVKTWTSIILQYLDACFHLQTYHYDQPAPDEKTTEFVGQKYIGRTIALQSVRATSNLHVQNVVVQLTLTELVQMKSLL